MGNTQVMSMGSTALFGRVILVSTLLALSALGVPGLASAAVGHALRTIIPAADASCGNAGGTSIAIVQGRKLAGVNSVTHPLLLAITCLDNSDVNKRSTVNFIDLSSGAVIKSMQTTISGVVAAPGKGWAHLVHRPDMGDLLGCGENGTIYSIDFSQSTSTADGTAKLLPRPSTLSNSCGGLAWDPEKNMIYQGLTSGPGTVDIARFEDETTAILATVNTPSTCTPSGLAITGGALVVACDGTSTILRFDKNTGAALSPNGTLSVGAGVLPDLGDLACDPVTFASQFRDALWSRNGVNGNGVVALEFPPFTCGLPSNATTFWAGLSAPSGGVPGAALKPECFDAGNVKDLDGDGLPDCWEDGTLWPDAKPGIDFDGDGVRDLALCVQDDTSGDGIPDASATECADKNFKDLFVEIDWMQDHKPDPQALSQTQDVASAGVKSVREAFATAPVASVPGGAITGIRTHFQVNEQVTFNRAVVTLQDSPTLTSHVDQVAFTPCTGPVSGATVLPNGQTSVADFDAVKAQNFGKAGERDNADLNAANRLNAKRLAFRYVLFAHNLVGNPSGGSSSSGCAEVGGDDAVITLGSFASTTVNGVTHNRGLTDQQAGTFMHELGHTLGLEHGGHDTNNCKPNYLSVMSYSRQFAASPIPNRRLDYSSAKLPDLNEGAALNEFTGLGGDLSLGPEPPFFSSADQTAFGPSAWSVVTATGVVCNGGTTCINWNRSKQGPNPTYQNNASANINQGPGGCDGSGTLLVGHNDWNNLRYRASAALDFAGGVRTDVPAQEITKEQEEELSLAADLDGNGFGDGTDCGGGDGIPPGPLNTCTHRIDLKPSFPFPKTLDLGKEANLTIAIFSEQGALQVWSAPTQVILTSQCDPSLTVPPPSGTDPCLKFSVESFTAEVKVNSKGEGTCSTTDVADPITGQKDGIKDLKCQFPTSVLPIGTNFGVVSGFFFDPLTNQHRRFSARQQITIVP